MTTEFSPFNSFSSGARLVFSYFWLLTSPDLPVMFITLTFQISF